MKSKQMQGWVRVFAFSLLITGLSLIPARSLVGQSQEQPKPKTEAEQLKERLLQLELTVTALKEQLTAIEEAKKSPQPAIIEATFNPAAAPVSTNTVPAIKPKQDDDGKGENSFEVYGFAMLDAGFQFRQNHPDWFDVVRPTKLPSFKNEFAPNGKTYWGVRQSRLGVKSSTATPWGELKTIFEFELFGTGVDAGQTTFRLRHAYGELGQFGAGQYWTVFGDTDAYPNTFEYWGPNGLVWFRNVQLRWMPLKGKNSVTIALERPGASADIGDYADRIEIEGVRPKLAFPDLTGNVRFDRDWGHVQFSGILRSIRWVDTNNDQFDLGGSATGAGFSFSSHVNFNKDNIGRFQFTGGKGIQNYMNDAPVDVGVEANPGDPRRPLVGKALGVFGMSAFLDHTWSKRFASSIGYSMLNMSNSSGQAANAYKRGHYGIGNFIFYPVPNATIAAELQWGRRENFRDGFTAEDVRLQFAFKYNFSKIFTFNNK